MHHGQSLEIQIVDRDAQRPVKVGNILVEIHFFMKGAYRFCFKVGRTNEAGNLNVSEADIEQVRKENALENLMDYNTSLADCDQTVRLVIPSEEQLQQQRDAAIKFYGRSPDWSENWPENRLLKKRIDKPIDLKQEHTFVNIPVEMVN